MTKIHRENWPYSKHIKLMVEKKDCISYIQGRPLRKSISSGNITKKLIIGRTLVQKDTRKSLLTMEIILNYGKRWEASGTAAPRSTVEVTVES